MTDLFPETLLVARDGERIYTTSLKVAEDAAAGLPRRYTAWSLGKSVASVSYHRAQARQLGVLKPARRCRT